MARKFNGAKWRKTEGLGCGEIPADAVTIDLRTQSNTLSFWKCNFEDAALAIASVGSHVEKLDIVLLSSEELEEKGQKLNPSSGKTLVTELVDRHVDVCRLDYVRLGTIARGIVVAIEEERCRRFTRGQVLELLAEAVRRDRLEITKLEENVQKAVLKQLAHSV